VTTIQAGSRATASVTFSPPGTPPPTIAKADVAATARNLTTGDTYSLAVDDGASTNSFTADVDVPHGAGDGPWAVEFVVTGTVHSSWSTTFTVAGSLTS